MNGATKILSYGALKSMCSQLRNQLSSAKTLIDHLKKENKTQDVVINQLKLLYK